MSRHASPARAGFLFPGASVATVILVAAWLLAGAAASPAAADPVTMRAEVDRRECTIDDAITLTVVLAFSEQNVRTGVPAFPKSPDFEVGNQQSMNQISIVNGAYAQNHVTRFTLLPAREGRLTIPPIRNFYLDPATGRRVELETPPIDVTVAKSPEPARKAAREAPLEPAIPAGTPFSGAASILFATVVAIAVVSFVLARLLKRGDARVTASPLFDLAVERNDAAESIRRASRREPDRPARDAELSRERLALLAREDERPFAREVSRLAKSHLERACAKPFSGATSDEILAAVDYLRLGGEARELVESLLDYADGVNYRGEGSPVERRDEVVDRLRRLAELLQTDDRR